MKSRNVHNVRIVQFFPEPYDWFCDDDVKLFCEKLKRTVAAALRPYESDEVDIPSDCPLE